MIKIIQSKLFRQFENLVFGFSTKIGLDRGDPYYFNMSYNVGDDEYRVKENRKAFFGYLGIESEKVAYQKQIHSDIIKVVRKGGFAGESDAMITTEPGVALAISSADCIPIFLYDKKNNLIAGAHSGWRGTKSNILGKTLDFLVSNFNSSVDSLFVYLGPSISKENYEVGPDVASQFKEKYLSVINGKYYLDLRSVCIDVLYDFGVPDSNVEIYEGCTYKEKELLHSYRRDGKLSGRALGVIYMKE
ncbi:Multi-copper polyphenol oxidoreductase laccase [Melioribacter roseus P3M-2]|uniref:Purine nucleoside phosphorylase n=1 Tax=Melioribacter roseus (strain DSM 23840 / JCM 17771 / VKM B-2668 / P3M-2) TaxID=1191523 RepID=I6Z2M4_MELRP|nr:peptidoglycan editing factor PgeF [Melioribacter roseus]AFN73390.1 Multi-copper polyphenol oxidoreductase laccase [Melioribacter roseus P3M-2]